VPGVKPYTLRHTLTHPLARMLPLFRYQVQVYRMGEKHPPCGDLKGMGPDWEAVNFVLAARDTQQARVNLQRHFTLLAIGTTSTSNVNGGFRAQFYDTKKQLRFADRGVMRANIGGDNGGGPRSPFFLREPYPFDEPDSQLLVVVQNFETVTNTIEMMFYGLAMRFNEPRPGVPDFPGGPVLSIGE
jgi:hypothetical protein